MMKNKSISVSEALGKIEAGQSMQNFYIDFAHIKVESLDVMKLTKAGIAVPDTSVYYNDAEIEIDDEFSGNWEEIDYDPIYEMTAKTEVKISVKKDIKQWVEAKNIQLDKLMENLLEGFYKTQKQISETK